MLDERAITSPSAAENNDFPPAEPIRFTLFEDRFASFRVEIEEPSLEPLAKQIRRIEAATKDQLPWLKAARPIPL